MSLHLLKVNVGVSKINEYLIDNGVDGSEGDTT
jgi:hypothetical protein